MTRGSNIAVWTRAALFRRFIDTNVYGIGSVKNVENSPQIVRKYTDIFTVYTVTTTPCIDDGK